jgi:hypothetical protein
MSDAPVFVAKFSDGEQTRMSVFCQSKPNLARAVRLSRHAYRSRKGREPPPMVAGYFELDGKVLERHDAKRLAEVKDVTPK